MTECREQLSSRGVQTHLTLLNQYGAPHLLTLTVFWLSVTLLRFRNNVGPTPWTSLGRLAVTVSCSTWYRAGGTAFICVIPYLLISIAFLQFLVVVNTRALAPCVTEFHWFWPSIFLSSRWTIGIRIRASLFHAEVLLFRNPYCLF